MITPIVFLFFLTAICVSSISTIIRDSYQKEKKENEKSKKTIYKSEKRCIILITFFNFSESSYR
jgi:Na+-transporting methylmalonyl-CoA/oxaloacetate decarboxylase gamma subunit